MTRAARTLSILAVALAAALYGAVTGRAGIALLACLVAIASLPRRSLSPVSTPVQALLLVACGVVALATGLLPAEGGLGDRPLKNVHVVISTTCLLLAALRTHIEKPEWGLLGSLGMGLGVFLSCGSVKSGAVYPTLLVPYVLVCACALRAEDTHRSRWRELAWRHNLALASILVVAGSATTALVLAIPVLYQNVDRWALRWLEDRVTTGFRDGPIALGSLEGLLQSDEIVMRIEGPVDEHLRGNVYTRYLRRSWGPSLAAHPPSQVDLGGPLVSGDDPVIVARYSDGDVDRFFLPGSSSSLQLEPKRARVDFAGVVRALPGEQPKIARFRQGSSPRFQAAGPTAEDLELPQALEGSLRELARQWTLGLTQPADKLAAIRSRLERDYVYSLSFERDGTASDDGLDPVLQFLLHDPQGHCEYFASAMALLARAVGVPTRVVTGYRAVERNPFAEYTIVRQRHAHAWVEAHVPDRGWITIDPSPLRSFEGEAAATTPWLPALIDLAIVGWQRQGPAALAGLLLIAFVGIQLRRIAQRRHRGRPRERGFQLRRSPDYMLAFFAELYDRTARRGPGESLETYAARVAAFSDRAVAEPDKLRAAEALLLRYAAYRYGEIGDATALESDVRGWIARP